mgnify:FL=1
METITALVAAAMMAALAIYSLSRSRVPGAVRDHARGAVVLLGAVAVVATVRLADLVPLGWLFDVLVLAVAVLVPVGILFLVLSERQRERQVGLLRAAATMLIPTTELSTLLQQVLDVAHAAVRVDGSCILLLDEAKRELRFAAARGIDLARLQDCRLSLDHPALAEVWTGQGPVLVPDVDKVPAFRETLARPSVRAFFAIPMVTRGKLVGFLNVHRSRVSTLTVEELGALTALAAQAAVAIDVSRLYGDLQRRYLDTVSALASAMEVNDPYTLGHSRRVAEISGLLASELNLPPAARETVVVSALLHDIGKLGISTAVLRKLGRLSPRERDEVRSHSALGALVLRDVEMLQDVLPAVLHHHERWDGTGYPHGLRGAQIPLGARIVAAADAYEVMTAGRSYRKARSPEAAMVEMRRMAGRQFDPDVVDALVRLHKRGELPAPAGEEERRDDDAASAAS